MVTLNGRDLYLGKWNTKASRAEHDRLIGEWLAAGRCLPASDTDLCVAELALAYWRFARSYYRKDGKPTGFPKNLRHSYTLKLENMALEFQEALLMANAERARRRGEWLAVADGKLVCLRALLRLAYDLELLAGNQVRYAGERVEELGRLLGAWRKGTDR